MIQEALQQLVRGDLLSEEQAALVTEEIMTGEASPSQIAAFLTALRIRGESVEEITGMARVMRDKALKVITDGDVVDVVGTGGDQASTFNISTASALVSAACGLRVAKHGNRAASGAYGAADILEANGVKLELSPASVRRCIDEIGIGFMFAPSFHPAMRFAGPTRRELGIRTVFNILGPLTNPAGARYQVIGVSNPDGASQGIAVGEMVANVLSVLGTKRSWVVRGDDGLDEITTTTTTQVWDVQDGEVNHLTIAPEDADLPRSALNEIQGDSPNRFVELFKTSLGLGESAAKNVVLMNSAAGLLVAGKAASLQEGVAVARRAIDSGRPLELLERLAGLTQTLE